MGRLEIIDSLLDKYKILIESVITDSVADYQSIRVGYLQILEEDMYANFLYGTSDNHIIAKNIYKKFLEEKGTGQYEITINGKRPLIQGGVNLRVSILNKGDYDLLGPKAELMLSSLEQVSEHDMLVIKKEKYISMLRALQEPITQLGDLLRDTALEYGQQGKKIYLLPMTTTQGGLGQYRKDGQSQYIDMFDTEIMVPQIASDGRILHTEMNALIIDGTNNGQELSLFNSRFNKVIRGLLEGRLTIQILAADYNEQTMRISNIDGIGSINLMAGALLQDQIRYTTSGSYNTLTRSGITFQDEQFNDGANEILDLFKQYTLYILPQIKSENSDEIEAQIQALYFISDFF
ncbi:hypothetical protein LCGC14_1297020 [marine sediment metagenome]|uniref:Uncharacterized protein n=1 Tax=marine sediment metagenome TaxID=412755 RepID=A0A0F9NTL4_9ZZZZ|nr:MAG: hypothetical protein Lokiarch_16520 [Candidatus Lokiarchaeum sp. GC14_75]HEA70493.1 hypothetical protein [archaeon]